jgi:hypothetical protein
MRENHFLKLLSDIELLALEHGCFIAVFLPRLGIGGGKKSSWASWRVYLGVKTLPQPLGMGVIFSRE